MRAYSAAVGNAQKYEIGRAHVAPIFYQSNMLRRFVLSAERTRRAPPPIAVGERQK
jgi:hypothetical protein